VASAAEDAASSSDSCSDYNTNGNLTPTVLDLDSDARYVPIPADSDSNFPPSTPDASDETTTSFLRNGVHNLLSLPIVGRGGLVGDDVSQTSKISTAGLLVRRHNHSGGNLAVDDDDEEGGCVKGNGVGGRGADGEDDCGSTDGSGSRSRDVTLKRRVGLFSGVALIVGTMIGKR
jgi:hypothetical protein